MGLSAFYRGDVDIWNSRLSQLERAIYFHILIMQDSNHIKDDTNQWKQEKTVASN